VSVPRAGQADDSPRQWTVRHNRQNTRFEAGTSRNPAHLDYLLAGDLLEIYHTEVPVDYRSQGVAEKLTRAALDWARESGYKVLATCSYVDAFITRHKEYQDLL
jgi:predicted GNAT family acetyltransferase